jgi:glycosyltransferase involved in cell wall biosynthesis
MANRLSLRYRSDGLFLTAAVVCLTEAKGRRQRHPVIMMTIEFARMVIQPSEAWKGRAIALSSNRIPQPVMRTGASTVVRWVGSNWLSVAGTSFFIFGLGVVLPLTFAVPLLAPVRRSKLPPVNLPPLSGASIDVVIPAYLEASVIGRKVRSAQAAVAQDAAESRVIVAASDKLTAAAAREAGADVVIESDRQGKPTAVNLGVAQATAEIVVITDANCDIEPPEWPAIARLELETAGLVSAHKAEKGGREGFFWKYEHFVKEQQGGENLSAVGEFIALRRADFRPIPADEIIDDLWLALEIASQGHRVRISDHIRTVEEAVPQRDQWERRVRIAEGMLGQHLPRLGRYLSFASGRRFSVHKFFRLTIGCAAFWVGTGATALAIPNVTLPATVVVTAYAVSRYSGILWPDRGLLPVTTAFAMQAVPIVAGLRLVRNRIARRQSVLWVKAQR